MTGNLLRSLSAGLFCALALGMSPVRAQTPPGPEVCQGCHADKVESFAKAIHGQKSHAKSPAANGGCVVCHGDGTEHVKAGGGRGVGGIKNPGSKLMSADDKNAICLNCHRGGSTRTHWEGSTHQARGIACTNCHTMHQGPDRVLTKVTQPEVCFSCHKEQRAQYTRPSRHPILEGKVACSDCHNPHGSVGPSLVKRDSINDTCYQCHMEKRGPFVHTHEPVSENCMNCHNPHGTVTENLLKVRAPMLCHQCHTPHGPNVPQLLGAQVAPRTTATTGKDAINYTMARGCLNCHTQVHGGNNPTVTDPTPQFMLR
ncbi:MAG TPA: DmsE family decaheme c-type cytochrome [Burkholderiales bacterium]|nr:DmsE family decaheme c-type cytochrome [Burkholderiales bacterium]